MSSEQMEVHRDFRQLQDRHVYFLLAAAGAAIGYAMARTETLPLTWTVTPLGLALASWCFSFVAGCRSIKITGSSIYANSMYLNDLREHTDPFTRHEYKSAFRTGVMAGLSKSSVRWRNLQYRTLLLGAVFYFVWQALRMAAVGVGTVA